MLRRVGVETTRQAGNKGTEPEFVQQAGADQKVFPVQEIHRRPSADKQTHTELHRVPELCRMRVNRDQTSAATFAMRLSHRWRGKTPSRCKQGEMSQVCE